MKKIILLAATVFITFSVFSQTTGAATLKYPFGAADFSSLTVDNDSLYVTVTNSKTYKTLSDTLVGNTKIFLTISRYIKAGDEIFFQTLNGATARTLTFMTSYFVCPSITTTASKTKVYRFVYNGTKFVYVGNTQID